MLSKTAGAPVQHKPTGTLVALLQEVASCHVLAQRLLQACLLTSKGDKQQVPACLLPLLQQLVVAAGPALIHVDLLPQLSDLLRPPGSNSSSSGASSDNLAARAADMLQVVRKQHSAMLSAVNPALLSFSSVQARRTLDTAAVSGNTEAGLQQVLTCAGRASWCCPDCRMRSQPPCLSWSTGCCTALAAVQPARQLRCQLTCKP
jgi:hypothetical protein